MAGVNLDEIYGLIRNVNNEAAYPDAWSHPAESAEGMSQQYLLEDQQSEASTSYAHESNYTVAPSTVYTSASTVFSGPQRRAGTSIATAPPRAAPQRTFVEQFHGQYVQPANNEFFFWCEFRGLMDCDAIFPGDDEAGWIQHHLQHLGVSFPAKSICWFCDYHTPFVAQHKADREATLVDRLEHIAEHVRSDHKSIDDVRPDFHMLEHLSKHHLISDEMYHFARQYTEVPREFQHPDVGYAETSSGSRHRERPERVNTEKEDRDHLRKKMKKKKAKSGW